MMSEGVNAKSKENSKLLVDIQIQLACIEKTIEVIPTLAAAVETLREIARNADQYAKSAHQRLDQLQIAKEIADEALRTAQSAIAAQNTQKEDQKWFKRTFYGSIITAVASGVVATLWAAFKFSGY
ncbi:hypothetical protein MUG84_22005 [Paenibacillus sp. KQZ6P-2]|uniref:Protein xhlA n=1 Tax=Paenibacillus mangrovi TaxID=2931978 RepID=A0A9X1WTM6_9BACL|nr:hypothetical protein [Paenibacillus mangrovi]MCJ8014376.1 hypothetical protein [Paenibacillus mangrovi]